METPITTPFKVFSGTRSRYIAEEICKELGVELGKMKIERFADGEFEVSFEESIRGCEVYLVQSTFPNCYNLMELLLMKRQAARQHRRQTCQRPYRYGWSRPCYLYGSTCRTDSGIFQCSGRPSLCLVCVHSISSVA